MLLIIKFLAKIMSILNGEVSPKQIAAGFALGVWIGLIPVKGLMAYVLLFFSFIVNVNLAILFVAVAIFKIIAFVTDPVANQVGFSLLTNAGLKDFWTQLYNMPIVPYTRFYNTIVMGSLVIGFVLLIPMYFAAYVGVVRYRTTLREKVRNSKLMKALTASTFYKYYASFRDITGG
jgi:uncharacterized protein (TIGR03546 family)